MQYSFVTGGGIGCVIDLTASYSPKPRRGFRETWSVPAFRSGAPQQPLDGLPQHLPQQGET
jgi:hypothetical protein